MEKVKIGDLFTSNDGDVVLVMEYYNPYKVYILFVETMYETMVEVGQLRDGRVRNKLKPYNNGVGFIGDGVFNSRHPSYETWNGMLKRCYNPHALKRNPTYRDCTVCEEWHNLQNFAKWYIDNYPKDDGVYQLDKDIRVKGNRVYSPETCMFVTPLENSTEANAKYYNFIDTKGNLFEIYNLSSLCREYGLNISNMCQVSLGNLHQHKGWTSSK